MSQERHRGLKGSLKKGIQTIRQHGNNLVAVGFVATSYSIPDANVGRQHSVDSGRNSSHSQYDHTATGEMPRAHEETPSKTKNPRRNHNGLKLKGHTSQVSNGNASSHEQKAHYANGKADAEQTGPKTNSKTQYEVHEVGIVSPVAERRKAQSTFQSKVSEVEATQKSISETVDFLTSIGGSDAGWLNDVSENLNVPANLLADDMDTFEGLHKGMKDAIVQA